MEKVNQPDKDLFDPDICYPDAMFHYDYQQKGYVAYSRSMPEAVVEGTTKDEAYINLMQAKSTLLSISDRDT